MARARAGLLRLGVGPGDRVVAYMPNIPETLVAFAATASIGAVWASCAPELGPRSVVDRLVQLEPTVLLTVGGYGFRDRSVDRREEVATIRAALPTLRHVVHVPYGEHVVPDAVSWDELLAEPGPLAFEPVAFDHPLFVLFSSGTTGRPKAIVHGHGGILLELSKAHALSWDLKPGGRLLWFSTTSWMMWNALVAALLVRSSIVMLDGDPGWPDMGWQWRVAEETRPTFMGVSPAFLMACRKAGLEPGREHDLSSIRVFGTAGSPLPVEGYRYVYEQLGPEVMLLNGSGGTDVCSGIVGASPLLPVYEGEISGRLLGVAADAFDRGQAGRRRAGRAGDHEADAVHARRAVGRHGRLALPPVVLRHVPRGLAPGRLDPVLGARQLRRHGRSDATLNRGGVRLGTGEFYSVIEELPEVTDSLVVHLEDDEGGAGRARAVRRARRRCRARRRAARPHRQGPSLGALAAPRAGHDPRGSRDPPHTDGQEARGARQAHPPGRAGGVRRQPGLAPRPHRARPVRRDCGPADHRGGIVSDSTSAGVAARMNGSRLPSGVRSRSDHDPTTSGSHSAMSPSPPMSRPMTIVESEKSSARTGR